MFAGAAAVDAVWYCELARTATKATAASRMSEWMVEMFPEGSLQLPGEHLVSPYSWRIAGVSVCHALKFEPTWITEWGFWRTPEQYLTYVQGGRKSDRRPPYGRPLLVSRLFDFALQQQTGRPFDFSFAASDDAGGRRHHGAATGAARTDGGAIGGQSSGVELIAAIASPRHHLALTRARWR